MKFLFILVLSAVWSSLAQADLYRWVDPETGSVKFSSYPPPWFGDEAKQRRAPKVEVIPSGSDKGAGSAADGSAQDGMRQLESLEAQRKQLLQQLSKPAAERGLQPMQKQLESYGVLLEQVDKLDPVGAAVRRKEMQGLIEKILKEATR